MKKIEQTVYRVELTSDDRHGLLSYLKNIHPGTTMDQDSTQALLGRIQDLIDVAVKMVAQ